MSETEEQVLVQVRPNRYWKDKTGRMPNGIVESPPLYIDRATWEADRRIWPDDRTFFAVTQS